MYLLSTLYSFYMCSDLKSLYVKGVDTGRIYIGFCDIYIAYMNRVCGNIVKCHIFADTYIKSDIY